MMFINRYLLIVCLVLFSSTLPATENSDTHLAKLLPSACWLTGKFSQSKQLADLPAPLTAEGQFVFDCTQGLLWITEQPYQETLVYRRDGKHYLMVPGTDTEVLKGRIHRELGKILNNLIGADLAYLSKHFDQSVEAQSAHLIPKNKRLRNYIGRIDISAAATATHIAIQQGKNESMAIAISQVQVVDKLDAGNCAQTFPAHSPACTLLFQ